MGQDDLILDRYEPIGTAGEGGFGTVQIAWDPRIQRKVAIKTIRLTALDAARAALPGAQAVASAATQTAERWHGLQPWDEYLAESDASDFDHLASQNGGSSPYASSSDQDLATADAAKVPSDNQVTALAHLPGLDEARTAAMLADPRIVTVYDFEVRGRTAYLIMEYVEGVNLADLLANYSDYLTLDMVAAVFDSVAGALEVAHEAGVLHLDIKPDNILINAQGQVKVTDFGLATLADASGTGKTGGGTIGYMPPEQIRREELDARSDEWSLASVLYEMLTGSNPFHVEKLDEAEAAIREAELVLPSLCWKQISDQIDDVVFAALDPEPSRRFASVSDFADEADEFLGDAEIGSNQLQLVVEDALGILPDDEPAQDTALVVGEDASLAPVARRSFTERFMDLLAPDDADEPHDAAESEDEPARAADRKPSRKPLALRVPEGALFAASHAFGAVASGLLATLALYNMQPLKVALGSGSTYAIAIVVAVVAIAGAFKSHIGALVSYGLLGIALVMCGHPIVGAVLLIALVAWWYTIGHEGAASANVALLAPLAGAIGASTVVPFFAGCSMRPTRAIATTVFTTAIAVILGGLGSMSLLGWEAWAHWDFGRADVSASVIRLLTQPQTWATIAGWMGGAAVLALCRLRESKVLYVIGVAAALCVVLLGSLALGTPSAQLIVSAIAACGILLAILA